MSAEQDLIDAAYVKQANKIKNDAKKEMASQSKNGVELPDVLFFEILRRNNIEIDSKASIFIKDKCRLNRDTINYKEALASLNVDLSSDDPIKSKWILRSNKQKREKVKSTLSVYSYGMTSVFSKKSKKTNIDKIIEEQLAEINRVKKIDDYLESRNQRKEKDQSPKEELIEKYFDSINESKLRKKEEKLASKGQKIHLNKNEENLREKRSSVAYSNIGKSSEEPLKISPNYVNAASEIKKLQLHRTFDIILNKDVGDDTEDSTRLLRKQHMEYPNYGEKRTENQQNMINDYNFKKRKASNNDRSESPSKKKELPTYLRTLFSSTEEIKEITKLMKEFSDTSVDHRILYILRESLIKSRIENHNEHVSIEDFKQSWNTL